jgi:hypothetical protein
MGCCVGDILLLRSLQGSEEAIFPEIVVPLPECNSCQVERICEAQLFMVLQK